MDFKHVAIDWKASAEGKIEGYGSVFNVADDGGDIMLPGCFTASLKTNRKIKMLMQHRSDKPIGTWDDMAEDGIGLRCKGTVLLSIQDGQESYDLVKAGALDGLSIGYRTLASERDAKGRRLISEAELWEVSIVTFPMNPAALIDTVKAAGMTERDMERLLTRDAGLSRTVAHRLMAGGMDAVKAMRDAGDEGVGELAALLKARCNL